MDDFIANSSSVVGGAQNRTAAGDSHADSFVYDIIIAGIL